jgi:hypothetical protein
LTVSIEYWGKKEKEQTNVLSVSEIIYSDEWTESKPGDEEECGPNLVVASK